MERQMEEQEIAAGFDEALKNGELFVVYQPEINQATERMAGAEAFIRWKHPDWGLQKAATLVPVLERLSLIEKADLFAAEAVCALLRSRLDEKKSIVPISLNLSRKDIEDEGFVSSIEEIRKKYEIPTGYLALELSEESVTGSLEPVERSIGEFHRAGYEVTLDHFGSGYSPLNVFRELDVDALKIDLGFLGEKLGGRGGVILNSLVQMAGWLAISVSAERVETPEQAAFLKEIGCYLAQGILYSKPVEEADFRELLDKVEKEEKAPGMKLIRTLNAGRFWDPDSLDTLIFNSYVGAAAVFAFENGRVELLRANPEYMKETGMMNAGGGTLKLNPWAMLDPENRELYESTIRQAIVSEEEEQCETWRVNQAAGFDGGRLCIASRIRKIGTLGNRHLFYARVENITGRKGASESLEESERRFYYASEMANIYAWEYNITTKEMRPCSRCIRDLGLPPLVENYPEPAIEAGIFPQDYADMYRDWHRQLAEGAEKLEAVIPLTAGRVPFHVRYTTIFDDEGKPLKAYGSATLVVDESDNG